MKRLVRRGRKALREAQKHSFLQPSALPQEVPADPVDFAAEWLGFKPTPYQADLLREAGKRIVVVFPRQSGKTTTLAIRIIHFALTHAATTSLIVAPGLRQSMIVMDRVQQQISRISTERRRTQVRQRQIQRTTITFKNGSKIVALPCSVNLLRGYSASLLVADEAAYFNDDQTVFYSVLFPMLQTTDGTLIASSTPWGKDSVFFKFTQDPGFRLHRITIDAVIEAGLAKRDYVQEMERITPRERYRREYLAEFVEDELAYFPQDLITKCIDSELAPLTEDWTGQFKAAVGRYFIGLDLGKKVDHSVIAITRWVGKEKFAELVGLVQFPLETPYATVIGMVKVICDKLNRVERVLVDKSGVGEPVVEDMQSAGIRSTHRVEGITLTVPSKEAILGYMKELMLTQALSLYYDSILIGQINVERYEMANGGQTLFSHPEGSHDDQLWALALAVYATRTPDTSFMGEVIGVKSSYLP